MPQAQSLSDHLRVANADNLTSASSRARLKRRRRFRDCQLLDRAPKLSIDASPLQDLSWIPQLRRRERNFWACLPIRPLRIADC